MLGDLLWNFFFKIKLYILMVFLWLYFQARGMCNQDEEDIAKMQEPLQDIKKQTQDELDKV